MLASVLLFAAHILPAPTVRSICNKIKQNQKKKNRQEKTAFMKSTIM